MQIKEVPAASLRHPRMAIETIAGVELPEWDLVAEQMDRVEVAAGERLVTPGKSDPYVYFVTAGLVKVQLNPSPSDPAQGVTAGDHRAAEQRRARSGPGFTEVPGRAALPHAGHQPSRFGAPPAAARDRLAAEHHRFGAQPDREARP